MGATLGVVSVFTDTEFTCLAGISDIEITTVNGLPVLLVGSEAESGVMSYSLADPGMPLEVSSIEYSEDSGTLVLTGIETYDLNGVTYAVTWGRYDDDYGQYRIDDTGALIFDSVFANDAGGPSYGYAAEMMELGGYHYLVTAHAINSGLTIFRVNPDGSVIERGQVWDRNGYHLGDVVDMDSGVFYGKPMFATAGALDAGIHIFAVSGSGSFTNKHIYRPENGLGFNAISEIEFVEVSGKPFLVVASAGTDSLHVLKLKSNYTLKEKDTYIDTAETRFADISCIETFTYGGRTFVAAAGGDEGVTLFEIDFKGNLVLLDVLTDDFDTTLANISDIEVHMVDNIAYLYVGSSLDHGFTVLSFDMDRSGIFKKGNKKDNTLIGTTADDEIWGQNGKDKLFGGAGDDRLHDGKGLDKLTGGVGADVFVFQPDPKKDWIMDFEPGIDRIDLSGYDNLWHVSSMKFSNREDGSVVITVGDDKIHVVPRDGYEIDADSFTQDDFIFG